MGAAGMHENGDSASAEIDVPSSALTRDGASAYMSIRSLTLSQACPFGTRQAPRAQQA